MPQINSDELFYCSLVYVLDTIKTFDQFYTFVCERKQQYSMDIDKLKSLEQAVDLFSERFGHKPITFLLDYIHEAEATLMYCKTHSVNHKESKYKAQVINKFDLLFPQYHFIGSEVNVPGIGKIDILAKDKISGRDVIIELKVKGKSPNSQLISYGSAFENPILVGITEEPINKNRRLNGIHYYTYSGLNI